METKMSVILASTANISLPAALAGTGHLVLLVVLLWSPILSWARDCDTDCNKRFKYDPVSRGECHIWKTANCGDLSAEAWSELGRGAYIAAAKTMSKRSPTGESLDYRLKEALNPHFSEAGYHSLEDTWARHLVCKKVGINIAGTDSEGQTYG